MNEQREQNNWADGFSVSRRELLTAGGATLVGAALVGFPPSTSASGNSFTQFQDDWMKEVVLPKAGSKDPVELSIAESRFWNEQMMEHAQFFIMLMPGAELADGRGEAERFQRAFADQLAKTKTAKLDPSNYAAFNRANIEVPKPYADWE